MKANRLALFLAAGATAFALTGCAPTGHVAVKVGSVSYSDSDVALLTSFECSIAKDPAAGVTPLSRATARTFMATVLVASAVDQKISEKAQVKPTSLDAAASLKQLQPYIEKAASGKDRDRLRSLVEASIIGQIGTRAVVGQTLGKALDSMTSEQQNQILAQGVQALRADEAGKLKITTDPALSLSPTGLEPAQSDTSLSRALSTFAKAAANRQPEQAWLDGLPTSQRCS